MVSKNDWANPNECPFCGESLASPGVGFVNHVDESPECDAAFDTWRDRVAEDVSAGWPG